AIDVGLFRLVLLNLISNSLESIADNGVISISLERTSDKTAIFVADNGAQISPDSAQNLFKLGFTTKKSHAGIGLYVSTRLLRQQHGDLSFARDFHKQTKNFCVMLPEYNLFEKTSTNIDALTILINQKEYYVSQLQAKLSTLRNQNVSKSQEEEISKQFKLLTTAFSQNLSNELLVIEATVLDVIQRLPADNIPLKNSFQKIINNCAYCRLLTRNILELGEGIAPKLMEFSLIDTAKDILSLVDRKMPSHLYKIDLDIDPLLPNIEADEVQMKQVFMNLIKNALDAMPNGGTLSIRIIQDENFALIEIGDTGAGIPPENITRLFHLGFTTKPRGYGIGLYSIKNILDRHHGTIEVFSKIQKGTIFRFRLPLKQSFER
ncbi:partial Sporulation kinase A, partial [Anaerolineae bacterium]